MEEFIKDEFQKNLKQLKDQGVVLTEREYEIYKFGFKTGVMLGGLALVTKSSDLLCEDGGENNEILN